MLVEHMLDLHYQPILDHYLDSQKSPKVNNLVIESDINLCYSNLHDKLINIEEVIKLMYCRWGKFTM